MSTIGEALARKAAEAPANKKKDKTADFASAIARVAGTPHLQISGSSGDKKNEPRNRPHSRGHQENNMAHGQEELEHKGNGNGTVNQAALGAFEVRMTKQFNLTVEEGVKTAQKYAEQVAEIGSKSAVKASKEYTDAVAADLMKAVAKMGHDAKVELQAEIADEIKRAKKKARKELESGPVMTWRGAYGLAATTGVVGGTLAVAAGATYGAYKGITYLMSLPTTGATREMLLPRGRKHFS